MCKTNVKSHSKKPKICLLLFFTWFILITPLIDTKIIPGHDYVFHVTRIINITEAITNGVFPVRMYVDEVQFWGTPAGFFYPSLFSYIPVLLRLLGLPIEICYNFFIALIFLLGTFCSWLGFSLLTRSKSIGFFSTILYISSGYYLMDAYIRNALGELLGLSFLPLAMACVVNIVIKTKISFKLFVTSIVVISAVVQSHVLCSAFLMLFGIVNLTIHHNNISLKKINQYIILLVVLFLLNAHFLVPFLSFYKNVPITIDFVEGFTQQGWPSIVLLRFFVFWNFWLFVALYFFVSKMIGELFSGQDKTSVGKHLKNQKYYSCPKLYVQYFLAGCLFVSMSDTAFPWNTFYPMKLFFESMQFPWRFLGIATLCFCVCGGFAVHALLRKINKNKCFILIIVCIICITNLIAFKSFAPISSLTYWKVPTKIYWHRFTSTSDTDYLYKDMDIAKLFRQDNCFISEAIINNYSKKGTNISFSYRGTNDSKIVLPLVHYPGYMATDQSGKKIEIKEDDNHMMVIILPKGCGSISVWYEGLYLVKLADYISLISILSLATYLTWSCLQRRYKQLAE